PTDWSPAGPVQQYEFKEYIVPFLLDSLFPGPPGPPPTFGTIISLKEDGGFRLNNQPMSPKAFYSFWEAEMDSSYFQEDKFPTLVIPDDLDIQTYLSLLARFRNIHRAHVERLSQERFATAYRDLDGERKKALRPLYIYQPRILSEAMFDFHKRNTSN
ncbi:MAG: hypothetical protein AAFV80_13060, partial [Bacteroidota bacterium]